MCAKNNVNGNATTTVKSVSHLGGSLHKHAYTCTVMGRAGRHDLAYRVTGHWSAPSVAKGPLILCTHLLWQGY